MLTERTAAAAARRNMTEVSVEIQLEPRGVLTRLPPGRDPRTELLHQCVHRCLGRESIRAIGFLCGHHGKTLAKGDADPSGVLNGRRGIAVWLKWFAKMN